MSNKDGERGIWPKNKPLSLFFAYLRIRALNYFLGGERVMAEKKWLTVKEVARILGVHEMTVRNLERRGELPAWRNYAGHRVFDEDVVFTIKDERSLLRNTEHHAA
jgi:excisionase family DNA binding protein